ncbi:MAG TPA: NAD(P)-dependent oxidoreductase [Acidimicrobiales bacterium]|nr:NAD(P)-dependent oxidoreductase [Acidimicrobiales bacterium]
MTSVLVTGGGGYIGQRVIRRFAAAGFSVRTIVREVVPLPEAVEQLVGELAPGDPAAARAAEGADVVVHLAGANEVAMAENPDHAVADTLAAARWVAHSGIPRAIYFSTVHVYGAALAPGAVVDERTTPEPTHPYGRSRLECEGILDDALPCVALRLSNGVGAPVRADIPRWTLVANELCREGVLSGQLTLRTSGVQWRDFVALVDVEDIVCAMVADAPPPGVYNLAAGRSITVRSLAGLIADTFVTLGLPRPNLVAPPRPDERPEAYTIDISKLAGIGFAPATPLHQAIAETISFCVDHQSELR